MKLLWAACALLVCCWRASASTGKNSVSAMLVTIVDFVLTSNTKKMSTTRLIFMSPWQQYRCKIDTFNIVFKCILHITLSNIRL